MKEYIQKLKNFGEKLIVPFAFGAIILSASLTINSCYDNMVNNITKQVSSNINCNCGKSDYVSYELPNKSSIEEYCSLEKE